MAGEFSGDRVHNACGLCCTKIQNFTVQRGDQLILDKINLHIHCGELTAIIGPNGAGKSTLLKAIIGEIPHYGKLSYLDASGTDLTTPIIGYVPQRLMFDPGSPMSVLDLFASCTQKRPLWLGTERKTAVQARRQLQLVQAEHLINRRLGNLSGGELQRVMLALALNPIPDLLLLDEPVSGFDQRGLVLFYQLVSDLRYQYDMSIILVSHDLELIARHADRIVYLNKTIQAEGTPYEVFRSPFVIEMFGQVSLDGIPDRSLPLGQKGGGQ
ncbi:MAG TPA: metal ABC transporter ATP-binding protein [Syntrophomonadaceae bacterium]|jgi:zinc transport system ATP-binding protein|nr:metal ABC transporter ATP-binding protein [Syntrophomonadaceae bacterium]